MGIFINLHIARSVTQEEWEPVYEESLALAKKFHLMDSEYTELCGEKLYCGVPVAEREERGIRFWRTIGDYDTMERAEDQRLRRSLAHQENGEDRLEFYDPLLSVASGYLQLGEEDGYYQTSYHFWGNKTQGETYHMYLLAIGCMIESRLDGKACVSGDITVGQCRKAVELVNQYLSEPIGLPVRCELARLYQRVRNLPLKDKHLEILQTLYLGNLDREYGNFVQTHFSSIEREQYWIEVFNDCVIGTIGFSSELKKYLNMGNGLEELCKIVSYIDKDGTEHYDQFVKEIMMTNLFLKEKDLRDCLEIDRETEAPYTIYKLMSQFVFAGAANHSVDVYVPLDRIREILDHHLKGYCDVQGLIDEYLNDNKVMGKEKPSDILNNYMDARGDSLARDIEAYDIIDIQDLHYYEKGDTIKPAIDKICIDYLKFYQETCEEEHFSELMKESAHKKCSYLIFQNRELFLMKSCWLEIFRKLEAAPECFRRYYPMVRVRLNRDSMWLVYAYVTNDDFYNYCEKLLINPKS